MLWRVTSLRASQPRATAPPASSPTAPPATPAGAGEGQGAGCCRRCSCWTGRMSMALQLACPPALGTHSHVAARHAAAPRAPGAPLCARLRATSARQAPSAPRPAPQTPPPVSSVLRGSTPLPQVRACLLRGGLPGSGLCLQTSRATAPPCLLPAPPPNRLYQPLAPPCHPAGSTQCQQCPVGTFNPYEGAAACINCPAGTYGIAAGEAEDAVECGYYGHRRSPQAPLAAGPLHVHLAHHIPTGACRPGACPPLPAHRG